MLKHIFLIFAGFISAHLLINSTCIPVYPVMDEVPDNLTICEDLNGKTVRIAAGGVLTIKLKALPGAGYSWLIVENDPDLLEQKGESFFEPIKGEREEELLGAPEYQVFHLAAKKSGSNRLKLHYKRQWERKEKPLKKFVVTVLIR